MDYIAIGSRGSAIADRQLCHSSSLCAIDEVLLQSCRLGFGIFRWLVDSSSIQAGLKRAILYTLRRLPLSNYKPST
jgi:hypothetical protein